MTVGYAALARQSFDAAEAQFREAATLYPGAPEPAAALIEVEQARTQKTLMDFKDQGVRGREGRTLGGRGKPLRTSARD